MHVVTRLLLGRKVRTADDASRSLPSLYGCSRSRHQGLFDQSALLGERVMSRHSDQAAPISSWMPAYTLPYMLRAERN